MTTLQSEVFEAFRAKAATALSRRDDEVSSLKSDMVLMKWMIGFVLAFQVAIAVKLFVS